MRRHEVIRNIVRGERVRSQGELARLLRQRGIAVAQPTLSRDVRELRLAKTPDGYTDPAESAAPAAPATTAPRATRLGRTLRAFVVSIEPAASLLVIKTPPAAAQPVARALDEARPAGLVGTIAGDDTVFVATPSERAARDLGRRLAALAATSEKRPA